jgi:hypothetical protein
MTTRVLTCPCSQTPEIVEFAEHPLGRLVLACSRFRAGQAPRCPGTCVVPLDRHDTFDHEDTLDLGGDTVGEAAGLAPDADADDHDALDDADVAIDGPPPP